MLFVLTVEPVIAFPIIVENWIILVEIEIVLVVDAFSVELTVMVLTSIVLAINLLPSMVTNPMLFAVNVPLVFDVNVLMVCPVAVEKYRLVAIRLFPTIKFRSIVTVGVKKRMVDPVVMRIELTVDILETAKVLAVKSMPDMVINSMLFAVNVPLVFDVNVLMVCPVAVEKYRLEATRLFATNRSWLIVTDGVIILISLRAFMLSVETFIVIV